MYVFLWKAFSGRRARARTFCVFVVSNVVLYLHWRREKRVKSTSVFTCGTATAGATTRPAFVADFIYFPLLIGPEGSAATTTHFSLFIFIFLINRNSRSSSTATSPGGESTQSFIRLWKQAVASLGCCFFVSYFSHGPLGERARSSPPEVQSSERIYEMSYSSGN